MPLALLGAHPKPASSPAPAKKGTSAAVPAGKSALSAKPASAKKPAKVSENSKSRKKPAVAASKKPNAKARHTVSTPAAKEKAPSSKPAALSARKKSLSAKASSARADSIPVIRRNSSEYIDLTYPPRAGVRRPAEAKKAPEKPARKAPKRSTTPDAETEEIPGITREQETAVASAGSLRR